MKVLGFDYPDALHYWLERDLWCQPLPDGRVRVGVTAFGIHLSGDFYMARPKPVGTALRQGQTLAVVELSKSIVAIKTPVSGVVCEVNPLLEDTPEVIHQDPYGAGWLACLTPTHWAEDLAALSHGEALAQAATQRMRLEPVAFPQEGA